MGLHPSGRPGLAAGSSSARFSGSIDVPTSGTWHFRLNRNGGVRLWVDDTRVIDAWAPSTLAATSANVELSAGVHRIMGEFRPSSSSGASAGIPNA